MKKLIKFTFIILASISLNAQTKTAIVTYKKVKTKKNITNDKKERLGEDKFKRFSILEEETNKTQANNNQKNRQATRTKPWGKRRRERRERKRWRRSRSPRLTSTGHWTR